MTVTLDVDLTDLDLYRNGFPHELFVDLRARGAVVRHPEVVLERAPDGMEFWCVLHHAELQRANRDWDTFSSLEGPSVAGSVPEQRGHTIVSMDPPKHTRVRKLISRGFTPKMIAQLDALVVQRTEEILDLVAEQGDCNFVRDVAYPLPMQVIADIVGIPDGDREWVFARTDLFMRAGDPQSGVTSAERDAARLELFQYATQLCTDKRERPTDDVWSILTDAEIDEGDGPTRLTDFEIDMFFLVLAVAGSETTRNAIAHGLIALSDYPDEFAALRADPGLLDTGTDEIIRWASPVTSFGRTATCDVELGGELIRAGDRITLWYPSANRDERAFDDPFRFDLSRSPNPHVSFGGGGVHYCLGAHLARREVRTMFEQLVARFHTIEVTGPPTWFCAGPDQSVGVSVDTLPARLVAR
jgi:cytochrome P450